jgi:predicted nucleic-acid-binding protein
VKAVDTNVLARFLARDDAAQTAVADQIMQGQCYVSLTVLLETVWLLASRYGQSRAAICDSLTEVVDLPNVTTPDDAWVIWAIGRFRSGADFADMAHLIDARRAESFVTFDRGVAKAAGENAPLLVETLQG